ncbi:hypothetical protein V9T40_009562 [Parthenolecanium corni]|uniref:Uncharacterized protein n=1 Tax=Parthenolecanium corni TaxID=536013 RepID=A0AAN9Y7M3_9HEMI
MEKRPTDSSTERNESQIAPLLPPNPQPEAVADAGGQRMSLAVRRDAFHDDQLEACGFMRKRRQCATAQSAVLQSPPT